MLAPMPAVPVVREIDDRASCIVWPAARVLLQWLHTTLKDTLGTELEGARVLELGAGTGFLSLALVQEGVEKVFAAEGDEDAWENLTQNVGTASQLQPVLWNWERDPAIPDEIPVHSLHLIVGSDLVYPGYYNERALAELIRRLVDLMSPAWHVPVLLLLCDREEPSGPRSLASFLGFCDALGIEPVELPLSRELLEGALGPLDGRACHEDPGGAAGTLSQLRLFYFGRGEKGRSPHRALASLLCLKRDMSEDAAPERDAVAGDASSSDGEAKDGALDDADVTLRKVLFDVEPRQSANGSLPSPSKRRRSRQAAIGGLGTVCVPIRAGLTEEQVQGLREVFSLFDPDG
ncbi:Caltractin, partial [Symbiodinium necroappetens]